MNEILSRIAVTHGSASAAMRSRHADLGLLASRFPRCGATIEEILEDYSQLKREDVLAAIAPYTFFRHTNGLRSRA